MYTAFGARGVQYGPTFRNVTEIRSCDKGVSVAIRFSGDDTEFEVHPAVLDAALQPLLLLGLTAEESVPLVPVSAARVDILGPTTPEIARGCAR